MRRTLVLLAALATSPLASAQTGLGIVPQGPAGQAVYTVTPQAGPWMICVASYTGPESQQMAEELVREIRTQFRLPAFVFNRSAEEKRKEQERIAHAREEWKKRAALYGAGPDAKPPPIKTYRIEDQYAVLVGGYKDDEEARKNLDTIRKLEPSRKLQGDAYVPDAAGKMHVQAVNPFRGAFVCRNPSVSVEKPAEDNQPDPRLKEYNAGEDYSLLKCRKPWTLVVKSYQGAAVVPAQATSSSVLEKWAGLFGKRPGALLNANTKQAREVTEFLRKFGFEAYVLHMEYSSYVTVGSFDGPDDPRLLQMQQAFVNEMSNPHSNVGQLHTVGMVNFFAQPLPMPVPQVK